MHDSTHRGARDRQGQANAGGARGLEYSLCISGWDKTLNTSKNTIMTLRYVTDTNAHTVM